MTAIEGSLAEEKAKFEKLRSEGPGGPDSASRIEKLQEEYKALDEAASVL